MVYIESWDDFVEKSFQLFRSDPEKTRYVMKYRHCDGKLVLKVTDDKECIKFKTDQAQDARKMEKFNNIFFTLMARGPEADISEVGGKEHIEAQPARKGREGSNSIVFHHHLPGQHAKLVMRTILRNFGFKPPHSVCKSILNPLRPNFLQPAFHVGETLSLNCLFCYEKSSGCEFCGL